MCFRPPGVEVDDRPNKIACPSCGEENARTRKHCFNCGADLPQDPPPVKPAFNPSGSKPPAFDPKGPKPPMPPTK